MSESKKALTFGSIIKAIATNPLFWVGGVLGITWLYKNRPESRAVKVFQELEEAGGNIITSGGQFAETVLEEVVDTVEDIYEVFEVGDDMPGDADPNGYEGTGGEGDVDDENSDPDPGEADPTVEPTPTTEPEEEEEDVDPGFDGSIANYNVGDADTDADSIGFDGSGVQGLDDEQTHSDNAQAGQKFAGDVTSMSYNDFEY